MNKLHLFICYLAMGMATYGQDIQSGLWFADGRSVGMGGTLLAINNECFRIKNTDNDEVNPPLPDNVYLPSPDHADSLFKEQDYIMCNLPKNYINKVSEITCRAYLNGVLPYNMNDLAVLSAGAVIDRKQYSWWLHGGWSGKDEQFVSLLFGHTVGQKWRYVVGVAMYRLDSDGTGVSRTVLAFMAEAGVFYRPLESLQIGVWMGNPTLTHIDSLYFAADFHLGAVYDVSERLQFVLEFEKQLQQSLFAHFGMEMAIWRPTGKSWRVDGRAGVRYPYTEVSAGLGVVHYGKTKLHFDAAAVCDWKLGWSFAASVGIGL